MLSYLWIVLVAAVLGGALFAARHWARTRLGAGRPVLVGELMRRQGLDMRRVVDCGLEEEVANCARTCLACATRDACRARLAAADRPAYRDICPNANFIDGLKA
jgi:hypothetical protein